MRGQLDFRKTLRKNAAYGGILFETFWRTKVVDRPRVIAICDVSGSVRQYARFLLLFLYSLVLTLSFTVTSQVRVSNPPRILVHDEVAPADYVEIAQEATLSDIRTHAFLSLGLLTFFGSAGAYSCPARHCGRCAG